MVEGECTIGHALLEVPEPARAFQAGEPLAATLTVAGSGWRTLTEETLVAGPTWDLGSDVLSPRGRAAAHNGGWLERP